MKAIGGYFELELPWVNNFPQQDAVLLNSGSNALVHILRSLPGCKKIYLPSYTCVAVLRQVKNLNLSYEFYPTKRNLEFDSFVLRENEYIIINNYFGIQDAFVQQMVLRYGNQLIVDNSQALYAVHQVGTSSFYSPRKYVGVPDGGMAYTAFEWDAYYEQDLSFDRCAHLLKRIDIDSQAGYLDHQSMMHHVVKQPIRRISNLSLRVLQSIDFERIRNRRLENYQYLDKALRAMNEWVLPEIDTFECPLVYPLMTSNNILRQRLVENKVFVATYWPNIREWYVEGSADYKLMTDIIPLPIDQRYGEEEMKRIIEIIKG